MPSAYAVGRLIPDRIDERCSFVTVAEGAFTHDRRCLTGHVDDDPIAIIVTALFHTAYSAVPIGKELLFEFTFVAFLLACVIEGIFRLVRNRRQTKPPTNA